MWPTSPRLDASASSATKRSELAHAHWPGPLTLVVPLRPEAGIASLVTAGLATVGIRVPDHPAMQALLRAIGRPLAAPSANASGSISPTRAEHVLKSLGGRIPLILDGGATERGIESTIVAATGGPLRLLRRGPVEVDAEPASGAAIESPGQLASHYAPSKPLRLNSRAAAADEYLIGFGDCRWRCQPLGIGRSRGSRRPPVRPASPGRCVAAGAHRGGAGARRGPRRRDQRPPSPRGSRPLERKKGRTERRPFPPVGIMDCTHSPRWKALNARLRCDRTGAAVGQRP